MTIKWEQTKGNHFQSQKGIDEDGNQYLISANREIVSVKMKDGSNGIGWTAKEALDRAMTRWTGTRYCEKCDLIGRQFCRCNSIPTFDPILLAPAGLTVDDLTYWHRRAKSLLGHSVTIATFTMGNS